MKDSVQNIGDYAISNCSSLRNVYHLSNNITSIGNGILDNCDWVNEVYVGMEYNIDLFGEKKIEKASGITNEVYYHISEDNMTLLIYGVGKMEESYQITEIPQSNAPWFDIRETLNNVKIEYGVENVGTIAFYCYYSNVDNFVCYPNLLIVEIGKTVTNI